MDGTLFKAELKKDKIILSGDMVYSSNIYKECEEIVKLAIKTKQTKFIIDSQHIKLFKGGEKVWNDVVQKFLSDYNLIYLPSTLAMNLQYDETYEHNKSTFLDLDDDLKE